ncbi:hypothetical protein CUC15_17085 [Oceanobacillus zhaokaii]|uniref:ROK family protein n=1 Tax=Oceanobacillus zhaokaii TaxID=2052660 RepID=A0A345PKL5_9BACI|nr:ROK family protein [Oceanobacillus zhaokaii]AXI10545.1 hypothetical protein CUC15_17085 [Oceanobacillus zhaokaii]
MYTIGIDISGKKIKFGLFGEANQIAKIEEIKTPSEAVVESMIDTIKLLIEDRQIQGIGIATAGKESSMLQKIVIFHWKQLYSWQRKHLCYQ